MWRKLQVQIAMNYGTHNSCSLPPNIWVAGNAVCLIHYTFMVAAISRARKEGEGSWRGSIEELEERRRGMLATEEWCNPVSNMLHHV